MIQICDLEFVNTPNTFSVIPHSGVKDKSEIVMIEVEDFLSITPFYGMCGLEVTIGRYYNWSLD